MHLKCCRSWFVFGEILKLFRITPFPTKTSVVCVGQSTARSVIALYATSHLSLTTSWSLVIFVSLCEVSFLHMNVRCPPVLVKTFVSWNVQRRFVVSLDLVNFRPPPVPVNNFLFVVFQRSLGCLVNYSTEPRQVSTSVRLSGHIFSCNTCSIVCMLLHCSG